MSFYRFSRICIFIVICYQCTSCKQRQAQLFTKLSSNQTGIHFTNDIHDTDSSTSFINEFGYMGGGVGIADFNNDGLKDVIFSGNQSSCRIYLNKGNLQFEDITSQAGLETNVWATGICIVDINNDGYDDIYISCFGKNLMDRAPNLLFINQHNLRFKEEAAAYGLADSGYSSQAVFFDYDRDGDLDMYLANYYFNNSNTSANNIITIDTSGLSPANDKLFRNDGFNVEMGHPVYTDVSLLAGIKEDGYGLGVSVTDINNDGWPDLYVANDFITNDRLWLNNGNGTFTNVIAEAVKHQSYSSMGVDAADINNDGLVDIMSLDMLPEWNERRKTSLFFMNYDRYRAERFKGYEPEFMRNMLQLNNGNRLQGDKMLPYFSEIGQLTGVEATDWSWSVLIADFNLDGWKDMHVTNGIGRDFINADFLEFSSQMATSNLNKQQQQEAIKKKLASLDHVPLPNYLFTSNADLSFTNNSQLAGIGHPAMSNGAAYADLDNDGDLDLLVNNIDEEAFVFENDSRAKKSVASPHYLKVQLKGDSGNIHGIGARLSIYQHNSMQVCEQYPVRGYFSSVDTDIFFGLGKNETIDSLVALWPNGKRQKIANPPIDTTIVLQQSNAAFVVANSSHIAPAFFSPILLKGLQDCRHTEYEFNDFANQRMLPQKFSQLGPKMAVADVNADGLQDVYVGAAAGFDGTLFLQTPQAGFIPVAIPSKGYADQTSCLFFDADGDKDADLLVTYGDLQMPSLTPAHLPRLFKNDGKGNFKEDPKAIPAGINTIAGAVAASDYDGDGDLDLFIGGRVADQYPVIPRSFILRNDHGVFTNVTASVCLDLQTPGMITSAVWTDFDSDGKVDLVIAGDWMPVRFFKNVSNQLKEVTLATGLKDNAGMWRSLLATDFDNDGDIDFIAGNLGSNCIYHVSSTTPMELYANDFDNNGIMDPVMFYYIRTRDGSRKLYPGITRSQFAEQVPVIKKKFLFAKDYATAGFDEIYQSFSTKDLLHFVCQETNSCVFENLGGGQFKKHVLPVEAQFAPVNAIVCTDVDGDGIKDLILAGNEYQAEVTTGRYDASYGCFLKGTRKKTFSEVPGRQSGLIIDGDVKDLALINSPAQGKILIAAINNQPLKVFKLIVNEKH